MTIVGVAPRGFNGTTLGNNPDIFVPLTMRGLMQPGFNGFQNRRQYWAYLFARLKPGVSIEQATVAINGPYRAIINDVEAPLQKGMSDADDGALQGQGDHDRAGQSRPEQLRQRSADAADHPARRHGHGAADRLRQHREPAAGARRRPRRGDGGAPVDRREPPAADHAAADRIDPARGVRRDRRTARREVDARSDRVDHAADDGPPDRVLAEPDDADVRRRRRRSSPASRSACFPRCTARVPISPPR